MLDDQLIQRKGIIDVVSETGTMVVDGSTGSAREAKNIIRSSHINFALIDLVLGDEDNGIVVGQEIREIQPHIKVVIYTRETSMVLAAEIFQQTGNSGEPGLQGYILTRNISSSRYLKHVYEQILHNGYFIDPDVLQCNYRLREIEPLTDRERECAGFVAKGYSNQEIAEEMQVSLRRIENIMSSLYLKFHIEGNPGDPGRRVLLAECIKSLCVYG